MSRNSRLFRKVMLNKYNALKKANNADFAGKEETGMSENLYRPNYSREKKITLTFDGITEEFTLVAPSAKDKEAALSEAQLIHAETVKRLTAATDMIKAVYLLHDKDLLIDAFVGSGRRTNPP